MPDPLQAVRQNVQQEATDELRCFEMHDFLT
jgi:hypothetical protein